MNPVPEGPAPPISSDGGVSPDTGGFDADTAAQPSDDLRVAAEALFGPRLELASAYARLLVTDGVVRGLIGPREAPRIWDRHLLNCAAMAQLISARETVVDVGSGAGLPGVVLAVVRPDISVTLVEPLARRTAFLTEVVDALQLGNVTVHRGRAEDVTGMEADVVTARAVAPLDRLAGWCLPLARVGGRLLALKGSSAKEEIVEHQAAVTQLGGGPATVVRCGVGLIDPPATVVEVECVAHIRSKPSRRAARSGPRPRR
jgi:16S rRNA (guanine527-N7)-methyltransferase